MSFRPLFDDQRTLVTAALLNAEHVARFTRGDNGRPPAGPAVYFFCLHPACKKFVEEALTTQECSAANVYKIGEEWFATAERGGYLFLADIQAPEKNPTLLAAARRQTEPFKITEFFTNSDGRINLFGFLLISGFGAFFLLGPLGEALLLSHVDSNASMMPTRTIFYFLLILCAVGSLYFLLDLPIKRWHWRRKTSAAMDRIQPPIR